MKQKLNRIRPSAGWFAAALLLATFHTPHSTLFAQGTTFTYEGRLNDNGSPANGSYDLTFALFSVSSGPGQLGNAISNSPTGVTNGLFSVALDFGANFPGADRWLEIGARTNGGGLFTTLSPRQKITPTPYAITAGNVSGVVPGGNLSGIYSNALTLNNAGNSFTGSGAGLIALNASQLASGTVPDARLSANVALLNANQTFSGINSFAAARGNFSGNGAGFTNLNLTLSSGGAIQPWANFFLSSSPVAGVAPYSVMAADVNGDGRVDLISTSFSNNTVSVFINTAGGGFVLASSPGVGSGPLSVVAADVNGDGRLDLISANNGDDTISVLTNKGNGSYMLASSPVVGHRPYSVVAADVNGDGRVDLISANYIANTLTVLTNDGSGGFGSNATLNAGSRPISLVAADVNGDGHVDLVSANYLVNTLTVLTNDGSGGFGSNTTLIVGTGPYSVVAADVNGDGRLDLICANSGDNTLSVLTNNGSGGFVLDSTPSTGVGSGPVSVVAADVNGDGRVDLVSANYNLNTLSVLTNNGTGGFVSDSSPGVGIGPISVAAADVNGDGRPDLITANFVDSTLSVLLNEAQFNGVFTGAAMRAGGNAFTGQQTVTAGNVGIGTSSPQAALHVRGANAAQLILQNTGDNSSWFLYHEVFNGNDNLIFLPNTGTGGYIRRSDGNYVVNSDARLKGDITSLGAVLARVLQLRPVSYHFRSAPAEGPLTLGLIAQEVEALFPEVVGEHAGMKGLAYSELVPVTIRAIQELNDKLETDSAAQRQAGEAKDAEIQRLEKQNENLQRRMERLERFMNEKNGGEK